MSGDDLPVVVGARRGVVPGDVFDQVVYEGDGSVVVVAGSAIDGVVVSEHRPCLLRIDGRALRVAAIEPQGKRFVYRCVPWEPGPFDRAGAVVDYDPERVRNARVEKAGVAARIVVAVLLLPFFPILSVLSSEQKDALRQRGLYPVDSAAGSIFFEWILTFALVGAELLLAMAGAPLPAVACGVLAVLLLVDTLHRTVLAMDGRDPGMLAWPRDLWRALRDDPPRRLK